MTTKVTIAGAGISGMAVASHLPKSYQVTIVARNLPGDPESSEWASPWAGAVWMGMADSTPEDQKIIDMIDLIDDGKLEDIWYKDYVRIHIQSLADLKGMGQDIVINSTGNGARHLLDVKDQAMEPVRGQTIFVKTDYNKISSQEIFRRISANIPESFPSKPKEFEVIRDIIGIRLQRSTGVRIEKEVLDGGLKVVHAYGPPGGGYIFSIGLAKKPAGLVYEFALARPVAKL